MGGKMEMLWSDRCDRRTFVKRGLGGVALVSIPFFGSPDLLDVLALERDPTEEIGVTHRDESLFAGIRKPIKTRDELEPRIADLKKACGAKIAGPLTHIFRFDTPVDGFDSEIGFPVSSPVDAGRIKTHTLRQLSFYSAMHHGSTEAIRETSGKLYAHMNKTGLSPELELVEIFYHRDPAAPKNDRTEVMASFLAWPEVYREQLTRVLGKETGGLVWAGGEKITPRTLVDERCRWVGESIERLKTRSNLEQQFDILSRVALVRPSEDAAKYKKMYARTNDIQVIFDAQHRELEKTRTGGFVNPPSFDGKILHISKVPYNGKAYAEAKTHREKRKAFCFCNLVREAENPKIDPVFCYRAAGWARQFWEPVLGLEFRKCVITHSILKGDDFCAWDYHLPKQ